MMVDAEDRGGAMPEPERVTIAVDGGVADVRMNRPEKLNALDFAMFRALVDAGERLASDKSVRAVVLSGEGRAFCAGLDIASLQGGGGGEPAPGSPNGGGRRVTDRLPGKITNLYQQAAYTWIEMPVPVIAAVRGAAFGGGIQIALAADIRLVAPDARLSVMEIRWGLVPDMTGTDTLLRLVGLDVAKDLTWSGRIVAGEKAVALGLATRVSEDPLAEALALARDIASKNPHAVRAAKRLLNQSGRVEQGKQFLDESAEMEGLIGSANQMETLAAYLEKREPVFADPS
jgi:enoyl-CoA hydratase/carnithine racemase